MGEKISDLNTVLKIEVAELKKLLQFHTYQWKENFETLDNLKNELLQKQEHQSQQQQQKVVPDLKEIKDKLTDLENHSRRNNLRINRRRRKKKMSHGHKLRRNYKKSLKISIVWTDHCK